MYPLQYHAGRHHALYLEIVSKKTPGDVTMIEKMQFVSITGPKADIDRVVDQYLSRYEIHLENALAQLQTLKTLTPYLQINPFWTPETSRRISP